MERQWVGEWGNKSQPLWPVTVTECHTVDGSPLFVSLHLVPRQERKNKTKTCEVRPKPESGAISFQGLLPITIRSFFEASAKCEA